MNQSLRENTHNCTSSNSVSSVVKSLGEVVRISKGKKPIELSSSKTSNAKRFIQIDDLRNNNILKYTEDKSGVIVAENDVLIAMDPANVAMVVFIK